MPKAQFLLLVAMNSWNTVWYRLDFILKNYLFIKIRTEKLSGIEKGISKLIGEFILFWWRFRIDLITTITFIPWNRTKVEYFPYCNSKTPNISPFVEKRMFDWFWTHPLRVKAQWWSHFVKSHFVKWGRFVNMNIHFVKNKFNSWNAFYNAENVNYLVKQFYFGEISPTGTSKENSKNNHNIFVKEI